MVSLISNNYVVENFSIASAFSRIKKCLFPQLRKIFQQHTLQYNYRPQSQGLHCFLCLYCHDSHSSMHKYVARVSAIMIRTIWPFWTELNWRLKTRRIPKLLHVHNNYNLLGYWYAFSPSCWSVCWVVSSNRIVCQEVEPVTTTCSHINICKVRNY